MLFCDRLSEDEWARAPREARRRELEELMKDFALSFPALSFRLLLSCSLINAQAVTTVAGRHVNIYGGLALHPELGLHSLVLAILHEVGHHLSDGPRSPKNVTLACECAADFWSINEGAVLLKERSGRQFGLDKALEELGRILPEKQISIDRNFDQSSWCWSSGWSVRKNALLQQKPIGRSCCKQ
jgi:hypothetical protein